MKGNVTIIGFLVYAMFVFSSCGTSKKTTSPVNSGQNPVVIPVDTALVVKDTVNHQILVYEKLVIGLLLPLQLSAHFENDTAPDTNPLILQEALPALNFYEGALLAKDTLSGDFVNVVFKVIDTGYDSLSTVTKLNTVKMEEVSAIVSLLPQTYLNALANASERWKKPLYIFSASNTQLLEKHPWMRLVSPSNNTQIRQTAAYIAKTYPASNFITIFREQRKENDIAGLFATVIDSVNEKPGSCTSFNFKNGGWNSLLTKFSKSKRNLLIIPTSDESFLSSILNKLKEVKTDYTFMLCGLPTWETFESVDPELMKSFDAMIFDGIFIDSKSNEVINFRRKFIREYHADPTPQAFMAFDVVRMIASDTIKKVNGHRLPNFNFLLSGKEHSVFTPVCENCGLENKSVNFLKYGDFEFVLLK